MVANYDTTKRFVAKEIVEKQLDLNPLEKTYSVIKSITEQFRDRDWKVTQLPNPTSKSLLHEISSPDGSVVLKMRGGKVYRHSSPTEAICKYKHLTKMMLELGEVPVPKGAHFLPTQRAIALAYFKKLPKPVVVKPTDAAGSRGVTVGISNAKAFNTAWKKAMEDGRGNSNILVEQFVPGVELRAYVIGDMTVSIVARIQPFVIGDGVTRITELIERLVRKRDVNYRTRNYPIKIDWRFVQDQGFEKNSTPSAKEIVFLNPFTVGSVGGLAVEVTEQVSPEIKNIAVQAKNCVPDLEVAGVDILIEDLDAPETAYVIEINTAASPALHRYATHGTERAVDTDVVDYFHNEYLDQVH